MPLPLIQIVLGGSFVVIWGFIAAMILRNGHFAIRDERDSETFRRHPGHMAPPRPHSRFGRQSKHDRKPRRTSAA